jgi:hypothetical protein
MESTNPLNSYLALLNIRQKAFHRNAVLGGVLFVFAILSTTATLLLTTWNERTLWLIGLFDVLFTMNFIMAWSRHEINKQNIELIKTLLT